MRIFFRPFSAFFFALFFFASSLFAPGFDHSALDSFLKRHVDEQGRINYSVAAKDRADLDQYLELIKKADIIAIQKGPKPENLAFWMNVYHAGLIALVLENYPMTNTENVPSFWERQFLDVGLKAPESKLRYSLSQIRNEKLSKFGDEKVHLVLATASVSGPLFPREAFTGPRAIGQLFKRTRAEVGRSEIVNIDLAAKRVVLAAFFQWYSPDFMKNFNRPKRRAKLSQPDTAVINFLIRYSKNIDEMRFLKSGQFKIEYAPYNWALNDRPA